MPRWHLKFLSLLAVIVYCSESKSTNHLSKDIGNSNSTCHLPDCRRCDILNLENCTCSKLFIACATGFKLSDDGCSCVKSNSTSVHCPDLVCPKNLHINEAQCECTNKTCPKAPPCPRNQILDLDSCSCICGLDQESCPKNSKFDEEKCICQYSICETSISCPNNTIWDSHLCQCRCSQNKRCGENFIFDGTTCDCEPNFRKKSVDLRFDTIDSYASDTVYQSDSSYPSDTIYSSPCSDRSQCDKCDYYENYNCRCWKVFYDCFPPWQFDENICGCKLIYNSSNCPGIQCQYPDFLDERTCICFDQSCAYYDPWDFYYNCLYSSSSSSSYSQCTSIPSCRECDYMDFEKCECIRNEITCDEGTKLSEDGCHCIPLSSPSSSTSIESSTNLYSPSCSIADCRWCDRLDTENCECHRVAIDCVIGYELSDDGCSCAKIPDFSSSTSITTPTDTSSEPSCSIPDCPRRCDVVDLESCSCLKIYLDCADGFRPSKDGCSCVESNSTSNYCPDLVCPPELNLNEARCECTKKICQTFVPCPLNHALDLEDCQCVCMIDSKSCPPNTIFDKKNCLCRNKKCDPQPRCPRNTVWDSNLCQCKCTQLKLCPKNFIFDAGKCDCIEDSPSPSCSIPDCRWCDFLDTEACECHKVAIKCAKGFITSEDGCSCIPLSSPSSSTSIESPTNSSSPSCSIADCRWCDFLDTEICECYRVAVDCIIGYMLSEDGCSCVEDPNYSPPSSEEPSTSGSCDFSNCRWCDYRDYENCDCYTRYLDCEWPQYILSGDGCSCVENPDWHSTQTSSDDSSSIESHSSSSSSCDLSDCRRCDYADYNACICYRRSIQCEYPQYILSNDGCDCVENPNWHTHYSSSPSPSESSSSSSNATPSSSSICDLSDCRWCDYADYDACICYRKSIQCEYPRYILSNDGCTCSENPDWYSTVPSSSLASESPSSSSETSHSPPIQCSLPECNRWCDHIDYMNCVCHPRIVDCFWPYQLTKDGCSCEEIPNWSSSSSDIQSSTSSSCSIPDCRWCDHLDLENCECYRIAIDCLPGYELSEDGCTCIKISNCSGIICPIGMQLNEDKCKCEKIKCDPPPYCPPSFILDKKMCECHCDLTPDSCPPFYHFDEANCICRHPPCDPPGPCPGNTDWNSESCRCECRIKKKCLADYIFNPISCDCELPTSSSISSSSSSSDSQSPCMPSCKWCDVVDYENCQCIEVVVDCLRGYELSPDGCSCIMSNITSEKCPGLICKLGSYIDEEKCVCVKRVCETFAPCPVNQIMDEETCECHCDITADSCPPFYFFDESSCICRHPPCDPPGPCPGSLNWNWESCRCECFFDSGCPEDSIFDYASCTCIPNYSSSSTELPSPTSSSTPCFIPSCRWCDTIDIENCTCHKTHIKCSSGFELSSDGCTCNKICDGTFCPDYTTMDENTCECIPSSPPSRSTPDYSDSSADNPSSSNFSSSSCYIPSCRPCDIMDSENCICHRTIIDCFQGYEFSEDGCSCVKSNRTNDNCPGLFCEKGFFIDEKQCECISEECRSKPPCPENFKMDPVNCNCFCNLDPTRCKYIFAGDECKCHLPCDPPAPCPDKQSWDPEECKCKCIQTRLCNQNFTFDQNSCDCVCKPELLNTECPSGSVFDPQFCECVEEIECYDYNDPLCACECEEILECPGKKEFDLDFCECMCPFSYEQQCKEGFIMSDETCECVKN